MIYFITQPPHAPPPSYPLFAHSEARKSCIPGHPFPCLPTVKPGRVLNLHPHTPATLSLFVHSEARKSWTPLPPGHPFPCLPIVKPGRVLGTYHHKPMILVGNINTKYKHTKMPCRRIVGEIKGAESGLLDGQNTVALGAPEIIRPRNSHLSPSPVSVSSFLNNNTHTHQ